jgi:hypothetical protein
MGEDWIMPSIDLEFYCSNCGAAMCNNINLDYKWSYIAVNIEPCENCLENAKDEGYENGYDKHREEVIREGD